MGARPSVRWVRSLVAAAVLATGLQLVPVAATAAPVGGTLVATPAEPMVTEKVVLTGSLPPAKARPVKLQSKTGSGAWTTTTSTTSKKDGTFAFTVTAPGTIGAAVRYRVLADAAVVGGTQQPAVQTPDVVLRADRQTSALTAPATVQTGGTIALVADFGPDRPTRPVELQRLDGSTWSTVATGAQDATGGASFSVPAGSAVRTVSYRAIAKVWQGAPREVSPVSTVSVVAPPDTVAPPVPTGLVGTAGDGSASLSWAAVTAADLAGYRVQQATSSSGPWTQVAAPTTTTHQVLGLVNGTTVWFAISSVDATGNESSRSAPVAVTPLDGTPPAVPAGLVATAGDGAVALAWDAVADATAYRVARAEGPDGPWVAAGSPTGTATEVGGLTNGTAYWFTVAAVDAAGNASEPSAPVSATPADSTPPPPVTLLSATPHDRSVVLEWAPSPDAGTVAYRVQVALAEDGPFFNPIGDITATTFTFRALTNGETRWYRVLAVDAAGNASEPSQTLAATPFDDAAPLVPGPVSTFARDRAIELSWGGEYGGDAAGFHVWIANAQNGPWTLVDGSPHASPPLTIPGLVNGSTYWFSVSSLDTSGNESARSEAVEGTPADTVPPPVPTGVTATSSAAQVTVSWSAVEDDGLVGYHVFRGGSATGPWTLLNWDPVTSTTFDDATVVPGTTYWYVVSSRDAAGNWSPTSAAVQVTAAETTPPAVPTGLVATAGDRQVTLSWAPVADADVAGYRVHRAPSAGGPWTADATTVSGTTTTVTGLLNGTTTWFTVSAVDTTGNESARSAPVSALPRRPAPPDATVSAGTLHSCEIRGGATLWCWGNTGAGQYLEPAQVGTASDWKAVDAGNGVTCAVRTDTTLWCWGRNTGGLTGTGSRSSTVTVPTQVGTGAGWASVSTSADHACAVRVEGTLWCWGTNDQGQLGDGTTSVRSTPVQVGGAHGWASVSAGVAATCATREDGTAWCWGWNQDGQLGDGTTTGRTSPVQVGVDTTWAQVSMGQRHACGTRVDGTAWCWGWGLLGQTGPAGTGSSSVPVQVGDDTGWTRVEAGSAFTCATRDDGGARCWGRNLLGELGAGSDTFSSSLPLTVVGSGWTQISVGSSHTCARRTDGTSACWGQNNAGQLGDGRGAVERTPQQVGDASTRWSQVSAGWVHSCGVGVDGSLWCWGLSAGGRLGHGTSNVSNWSTRVGTANDWVSVSAGSYHSCAVRTDGSLWCWGGSPFGVGIGDGTTTERPTPVPIGTTATWSSVSVGNHHTCGVRTDGTAWCWGFNEYGSVGDGTTTHRLSPVQVGAGTDWVEVSAGFAHTCGRRTSGSVWCWGSNSSGALGTGTSGGQMPTPVQVGSGSSWTSVDAGASASCALRADSTAWCWGSNVSGQLGDGTGTNRDVPTPVLGGGDWATVSAGWQHACGTRVDGSLWCWGGNDRSQVGDGTVTGRATPVRVHGDATWTDVSAGQQHSCAVRDDGVALCWGANEYGQAGRRPWATAPVDVVR